MVAVAKLRNALLSNSKSLIPTPNPMPMIGPMRGEINMAPMMTAAELVFSPKEATKMAKIRIHRLAPRNSTLALMEAIVSSSGALSLRKLSNLRMNRLR